MVRIEVVLELVWNSFSCFCKIWWFESDGCFPTLDRPVSFDSITSKIFFIRPTFELTLERKTCLICQILWENKFSRREEMSSYLIIFSFNQFTQIFHVTVWSFPQSEIFLLGAPQVCITVGNQSSNRHSVAKILNWSFSFDPIKLTLIPFSTWRAFFTGNIYCKWTKPLQKVKSFLFHLRDCPRQPLGIRWELDYCILQQDSILFPFFGSLSFFLTIFGPKLL